MYLLSKDQHRQAIYLRGGSAKIQTVGRKWVTLDNGMRFGVDLPLPCETHMGPNDVGYPYDVFASQADMDAFKTQRDEVARMTRLIHSERFRLALPRASIESLNDLDTAIKKIIIQAGGEP